MELVSGHARFGLDGAIGARHSLNANLEVKLGEVRGQYAETGFAGAAADGVLTLANGVAEGSASVKADALEYGIEITNLACELDFKLPGTAARPRFRARNCRARTLGSRLAAPDFVYDMNRRENRLQLEVTGLDIAQVLALQEFAGLEATGRLDGALPLALDGRGLRIIGGALRNQSAGVIRYRVDPEQAAAAAAPLTDIVTAALSDFRYDRLTAAVDYAPEGDLHVDFHIEGSSPNFENSRRVNLNVSSEQNILSLLRSLDYAAGLNRQIDDKLRNHLE